MYERSMYLSQEIAPLKNLSIIKSKIVFFKMLNIKNIKNNYYDTQKILNVNEGPDFSILYTVNF